jgi:hypothetical protein
MKNAIMLLPIDFQGINALKEELKLNESKGLETSLRLGAHISVALQVYKTTPIEGITTETFIKEVFGMEKSHAYRLKKASELPEGTLDAFRTACDRREADGKSVSRSINALLKFAQQPETDGEGDGEGDGDGDGEGDGETAIGKALMTLSFRGKDLGMDKNMTFRINADGSVPKQLSEQEIEFLCQLIRTSNAQGHI